MNLEIIPAAVTDINDIAHYYRSHRESLDDEFLAEVAAGAVAIADNPLRFNQVRLGIRRYMLDRFPYGIYFRVMDAGIVRIIVVKHHSRGPGLGMRRK